MVVAATRGLALGKWVHNVGGVVHMITFAALILLPLFALSRAMGAGYQPFTLQFPTFTEYNINVASKLALGALTGFEYIAIARRRDAFTRAQHRTFGGDFSANHRGNVHPWHELGGRIYPARSRRRDWTDSAGAFDWFGSLGWVGAIGSIAILGIAVRTIALMSLYFVGNTRLPMVAGWDRLLPAWFSRLHPKYKTPINSILFVGAVTMVIGSGELDGRTRARSISIDRQCGRSFLRADVPGFVCDSVVWNEGAWRQSAMVAQGRLRVGLHRYFDLHSFRHRSDYGS